MAIGRVIGLKAVLIDKQVYQSKGLFFLLVINVNEGASTPRASNEILLLLLELTR